MKFSRYVHLRGNRYIFRIRYPQDLLPFVTGKEFKRSLRTSDRSVALRNLPSVIQEYQDILEDAEAQQKAQEQGPLTELSDAQIRLMVAQWCQESRDQVFKQPHHPTELTDQEWDELERQTREKLDRQRRRIGRRDYSTVRPIVNGLLRRKGIHLDPSSDPYFRLCNTVLRAWVALEQVEYNRQRGFEDDEEHTALLQTLENALREEEERVRKKPDRTLDDLIEGYQRDKSPTWSKSTESAVKTAMGFLRDLWGAETLLKDIEREEARETLAALEATPLDRSRKFKGMTLKEAIMVAGDLDSPTLSGSTINKAYLAFIDPAFQWAENEGWIRQNPFKGLKSHKKDSSQGRTQFTMDDLQTIFSSTPWAERDENHEGKPSLFWVPLIALFQGRRRSEIAGLKLSEIFEEDGFPAICIIEADGEERGIKTDSSMKPVPIHPELIKMGFLRFVERQRAAGHAQLFPESKVDTNGKWGRHITSWFGNHIQSLGIGKPGDGLHCFRHTFQDAIRRAGLMATAEGQALGGRVTDMRAANLNADPIADQYGTRFRVGYLRPFIEKITFPGLDLSHLYVKDPRT